MAEKQAKKVLEEFNNFENKCKKCESEESTSSSCSSSNQFHSSSTSSIPKRKFKASEKPPSRKMKERKPKESESSSKDEENDNNSQEAVQLLSLGAVEPLFELADKSDDEQEEEDIKIELIKEYRYPRPVSDQRQTFVEPSTIESQEWMESIVAENEKKNKSIGRMFKDARKHMRSSLSTSNFKKLGKQAMSSFSKTTLDGYDLKPQKPVEKSSRHHHHHHHASRHHEAAAGEWKEEKETLVEAFKWNPVLHTDPDFKAFVAVTKYSNELPYNPAPPDWLACPLPEEGLELGDQFCTNQDQLQLVQVAQAEYKNIQKSQTALWENAVHIGEQSPQDFRRIFLYVSSKVELVTEIRALAYSNTNGNTLAIGSHDGLLKLVEFKEITNSNTQERISSVKDITCSITRNESLRGHIETVNHLSWLPSSSSCGKESKLMSTDDHGVIIGWKIFNTPGNHKVDFLQDQTSSNILEFSWSPDASKVCIIYADNGDEDDRLYGMVMGSSNGKRMWSRSLTNASPPQAVKWLDQTSFILVQENAITVSHFNGVKKQSRYFGEDELGEADMQHMTLGQLVSLLVKPSQNIGPISLALIWEFRIIFLKNLEDLQPLNFEPQLTTTCADWSPNGAFIAVAGLKRFEEVSSAQVNVYNCSGKLLTILKIHQSTIQTISWNADSTNFAMGSNTLLYVASIRPVHKFASNGSIHAYAFESENENFVAFWDVKSFKVQKVDGKVVDLKNCDDRFVLLSMNCAGVYSVSVLSRVGLCIDVLIILTMEPFEACLTDSCIICLSAKSLLFWRYNTSLSDIDFASRGETTPRTSEKLNNVRQIHIDDLPSLLPSLGKIERKSDCQRATMDVAVCMDAKFDRLCVARFSGKIQIYCLPQGGLLHCVEVAKFSPFQIMLNPTGNKMALLDMNGCLKYAFVLQDSTIEVDSCTVTTGILNMVWSKDMPDFLCVMKRTEMSILHNGNFEKFEEYHSGSGYLAGFNDMVITLLNLEQILQNPHRPDYTHVIEINMKILEFTRQSFQCGEENEIEAFKENVKMINHPKLWDVCGEEELKRKNFEEAELAFITSKNYSALQFLKRIKVLPEEIHEAEIYAFLGHYEKASEFYLTAKRMDLALEMWKELGDENQRLKILRVHDASGFKDLSPEVAERHFRGGDTNIAFKMFKCLKQYDRAFECLMMMDNCSELTNFVKMIPKDHEVLGKVAEKYAFLGMTKEAVDIYLEAGLPQKAVEIAMSNLDWGLAVEIASENDIPMVSKSIINLTKQLLSAGNIMQAVQFLKTCGKFFTAGKLLATMAIRELQKEHNANLIQMKKLFVMSAILLQQRTKPLKTRARTKKTSFLEDDDLQFEIPFEFQPKVEEFRWMSQTPWRGALAVHYLILAQSLIYKRINGSTKALDRSIIVSSHLRTFTCILGEERVNTMVALACANGERFTQCIGALTQLENINEEDYSDIALEIFGNQQNTSEANYYMCCGMKIQEGTGNSKCPKCDLKQPVCVLSGSVLKPDSVWVCRKCGANANKKRVKKFKNCPVCHCFGT